MKRTRVIPNSLQLLLFSSAALSGCIDAPSPPDQTPDSAMVDVSSDAADGSDGTLADAAQDTDDTSLEDDAADAAPDSDSDAADSIVDASDTQVTPVPESCPAGTPGERIERTLGSWTINVDSGSGAWSASNEAGDVVFSGPGICSAESEPTAAAGRGEPVVESAFGSFRINPEASRAGMNWLPATSAPEVVDTDDELRIEAEFFESGRWALSFRVTATDELRIAFEPTDDAADRAPGYFRFDCDENEAFFGLGAQTVSMDLRGRTYPLWTQEQGIGKPESGAGWPLTNAPEASYAPMGVWHSSRGYSALVGHDGYHALSLCDEDRDGSRILSFPDSPIVYLMPGEAPADRMVAITERTGRPSTPPDWVFAPWNDAVTSEARVRTLRDHLVQAGIPSSAIWAEDWIGGYSTPTGFRLSYDWVWSQEQYPELPTLIDELHDGGFAFLGYFNTFTPSNLDIFRIGAENGWLVRDPANPDRPYPLTDAAFRDTGIVDLSTDDGREFFASYMTTAADDLGIDGWMADFTEWMPVDGVLNSGESGWEYHNRWPLDFQALCRRVMTEVHAGSETEAENNWTFFVRSGWASYNGGTGGLAPVLWGGDQNTTFAYDDGLPSVIPIATHAGLSGVPLFGSDIAGYSSFTNTPTTTKELFFRWTSLGAFHPVMRTHHGSTKCDNWALDFDTESTEHFRRYAVIHTRLFHYLKAAMTEAEATGMPVTRHPWLQESENEAFWRDSTYRFFLGENLLVQPVVDASSAVDGAVEVQVVLPSAGWWPLLEDAPVATAPGEDGLVQMDVSAAITEIPVFVRPGTALVLADAGLMTLYGPGTDERPGLEQLGHHMTIALYPDPSTGALQTTSAAEVQVSGSVDLGIAWPQGVRVGEFALDECTVDDTGPCVDSDADQVRWSASADDTLVLRSGDDSLLTVSASADREVRIAFAGAAFDPSLRSAEPVDLAAEGASWCATEGD